MSYGVWQAALCTLGHGGTNELLGARAPASRLRCGLCASYCLIVINMGIGCRLPSRRVALQHRAIRCHVCGGHGLGYQQGERGAGKRVLTSAHMAELGVFSGCGPLQSSIGVTGVNRLNRLNDPNRRNTQVFSPATPFTQPLPSCPPRAVHCTTGWWKQVLLKGVPAMCVLL